MKDLSLRLLCATNAKNYHVAFKQVLHCTMKEAIVDFANNAIDARFKSAMVI